MHGSGEQQYIGEQGRPSSIIFFLIITQPSDNPINQQSFQSSITQSNQFHQHEVLSRYRCHHGRLYHGLSCLGQALV